MELEESTQSVKTHKLTKWTFQGMRNGSQWYALDGVTKISHPIYHKYTDYGDIGALTKAEQLSYMNGIQCYELRLTPERQNWIHKHQFDFGYDAPIIYTASEILDKFLNKSNGYEQMSLETYNAILEAMVKYTSQF